MGFESKEYNEIFAGRIDGIWLPLLDEYTQASKKILFGDGRFATKVSDSAQNGILVSAAGHPHNMYLEQILDAGLLGLMTFILFYFVLLKKASKNLRIINKYKIKEYQYAVIASLISYLVSGLTGRSFFPNAENSYVWIIVGMAIVINTIVENSGEFIEQET